MIRLEHLPASIRAYGWEQVRERHADDISDSSVMLPTKLCDILSYAGGVKRPLVERKIEQIYRAGQDIKPVLREEGLKTRNDYNNFRKKVETSSAKVA